jgi:hypothetical protein
MPSRRTVMAALAVSLAGCSALRGSEGRTVFDADIDIDAGDYRAVEIELQEERTVVYGVTGIENGKVDILLLPRAEFDAFTRGEEFESWYSDGLGVSGGWAEATTPAGEYVVVFDNSERGTATPDGRTVSGHAEVEVELPD